MRTVKIGAVHIAPPVRAAPISARRDARAGAAAMVPVTIGYVPFALVVGAAVADHDAGLAGWAGSWLIFGGSAHLAAVRLVGSAGAVVAVVTALLVNVRLLAYSSSLARGWRDQPRWFHAVAAALLIDPTWALAAEQVEDDPRSQRRFFLASGLVLGVGWSAGIAVGAVAGSRLQLDTLDVSAPLCLLALLMPRLLRRGERMPMITAAVVALGTAGWAPGTSQLAAIGAGWAAGALGDRWAARRKGRRP